MLQLWLRWSIVFWCLVHNTIAAPSSHIDSLLRNGVAETDLMGHEDFIVLVGGTGTGKSALSKFIRKDESMKIAQNEQMDYIFVDNEVKIGSQNSHTSKTFFPNVDIDPMTNLPLIDCAGFRDTRSAEFDLVASYLNKNILDSAKRFKIIIVENYANVLLNNFRSGFLTVLKHLANLIKSNIDSFGGAIGLVASKIDSGKSDAALLISIKVYVSSTRDFLLEQQSDAVLDGDDAKVEELELQIKITDYLLQGNYFGLFRRPNALGSPWKLGPMMLNYNLVRRLMFEKLNFSSPFSGKFSVSVAPATINYINEHLISSATDTVTTRFKDLGEEMTRMFDERINMQPFEKHLDYIISYSETSARQLQNLKRVEDLEYFVQTMNINKELWQEIMFQASKVRFFYEVVGKKVNDFEVTAANMFGSKATFLLHMDETRKFFDFCRRFVADFDTYPVQSMNNETKSKFMDINEQNFNIWRTLLAKIGFHDNTTVSAFNISVNEERLDKILYLASNNIGRTTNVKVESGVATFTGRYVVLSQIAAAVERNDRIEQIVFIATKKIFIDCDLNLKNKHLMIIGTIIETIDKERKIYMKGDDAQVHAVKKARELSQRGANGFNGFSSGAVTIVSLNVINPHLLVLHSVGGAGSAGQHGGDGYSPTLQIPDVYENLEGKWDELKEKLASAGMSNNEFIWLGEERLEVPTLVVNYFKYVGKLDIFVRNEASGNPGNGGNGGDGGIPAHFGTQMYFIKNISSIEKAKKIYETGLEPLGGIGGDAGKPVNAYSYRKYYCEATTENVFVAFVPVKLKTDGYYYYCSSKETGFSSDMTPKGSNGQQGKSYTSQLSYKYAQAYSIFHAIEDVFSFAIKSSAHLPDESEKMDFLEYFVTDLGIVNTLTIENYLYLVKNMNSFLEKNNNMGNVETAYLMLYRSFRSFMQECKKCDIAQLKAVELLFISRLNYLQTFSIGKQIVHLPSAATKLSNKLSTIKSSVKEIAIFATVETASNDARKEIEKAGELIENIHKKQISEVKHEVDAKFGDLLDKTKQLQTEYQSNIKELTEHKRAVEKSLIIKTVFGTLNVFAQVASVFFPPAAMIGTTLNTLGSAISQNGQNVDLKARTARVPKGLDNAMKLIQQHKQERERDDNSRKIEQLNALKMVIETEASVGNIIIDEAQRKAVKEMLVKYKGAQSNATKLVFTNLSGLFDSVGKDLTSRISKYEKDNVPKEKIDKLKLANKGMNYVRQLSLAPAAIVDVVTGYMNDQSKLGQINAAIESNRVALQEMARYEKSLNDKFMPMLEDMLRVFEDLQKGLRDTNSVMLQFRKINIKKHARRFVSLINRFTQDFVEEGDGIGDAFVFLEEYMSILIDAYDKLNELEYRLQLKDFLGRLHGGDCSRSEDPKLCNRQQKLVSEIHADEMFGNFLYIFTAYQQTLFPFGGSKTGVLHSTVAQLKENHDLNLEGKVVILQEGLNLIIDDLHNMQDAIINDKEKSVVATEFNSKYTSSSPFFTWKNSKYQKQIKQLLKGEQVTLSASVMSPGVKNAVKFNSLLLNLTSSDPQVARKVHELLTHFQIEMVHTGESHYKCGGTYYVIGGDVLNFKISFEKNEQGGSVSRNTVFDKMSYGDVPLSPYTVWKFQLLHRSNSDKRNLLNELEQNADSVDLELAGAGFFVEDGAPICDSDLGQYYQYFGGGF
ncbi:uncharacterized protein LOC132196061 [Neocloeon triangulifer]|uniref:uncharacterized protein LOC132196061 n=1 Tax=Neocloeon triangulifer TaxID=2078957 RepID=UPI00286F1BD3|nr:uncharacterized protein LOC132196061 [Neocloeon triangulifer]